MSTYTWLEQFSPVEPSVAAGEELDSVLTASILKLEGLLKKNLANHQCRALRVLDCLTIQDRHGHILPRWHMDCPLCIWAWNQMRRKGAGDMCSFCPVQLVRGNYSCSVTMPGEPVNPLQLYWTKFDIRPMLTWFRRAERYVKRT